MPLVGLGLGRALGMAVGSAAAYVAIALLAVAGLALLREDGAGEGAATLVLGLSVSLDELAIGFALGLLHVSVWLAVVLIAAQAFVLAQVGLRAGARIGSTLREGAERVAAVVLFGLAVVLLVERVG
jgi:putative Mn2+ efflux pump MntP